MQLFNTRLHYFNSVMPSLIHILAITGFFVAIWGETRWQTIIYHSIMFKIAILGVTMGSHRLWTHRSFKANKFIQAILIALHAYSGQHSVYDWTRDHRLHHQFSDTEADPHNINRGLFYSQIGWIFLHKTEEFKEKVKKLNMDDLKNNSLVMFEHRYYPFVDFALWSISASLPCLFWSEKILNSWSILIMGICISFHHTGTVNSLAHFWGWKPYSVGIEPTFSRLSSYLTLGEGYHNYHHTFPRDYSVSELPWSQTYNITALIIDICDYFGWISDKIRINPELIENRRKRTGDLKIDIRPCNIFVDYISGLIVYSWDILLIFFVRYLTV